ncbi:MAG: fatty acid desaturase [Verrucomicrobiales bacterium]|nr:fatty acid desaturase [Verrucomicrobiales bacterium]
MATGHSHQSTAARLLRSDPVVKKKLREFLETDNHTNFFFIARAWFIIVASVALALLFFLERESWGLSFWWNIPVFIVGLLTVGASQHQLAGAAHEAVHHTLFKNRKLNELAGDFLCAFPILISVHQFRLYHLAHHQFVNDPKRDPDFALLKDSGHWLKFPVSKAKFLWMMFRQIFLIDLVKYILVRVRYNTIGTHAESPYLVSGKGRNRIPERGAIAVFFLVIAISVAGQRWGEAWMIPAGSLLVWGLYALVLRSLQHDAYEKAKIAPVFHPRLRFAGQTAVFALIVAGLSFWQMTTGLLVMRAFTFLFYGATVTTLPFFLILRQVIQHGNGDRGWLSNTRVFQMNPFVRYAIFPFGMDYHLPHHMYATIPHYRLRAFHQFLLSREQYRENCRIVDNYVIPSHTEDATTSERNPTVVEVLGPEYACVSDEIHIDDSVLDNWEVEGKDALLREGRITASTAHRISSPEDQKPEPRPLAG